MNELYARIEALEQLVNQQAASFQRVPSQGFGATDSVGTTSIPTPTEFIWIRITEQPDATHAGYSWEQVVPIGDGTFDDPAIKLTGNNAVTSGSRYAVAYEENGSESVAVDTVVRAWPAYYDADPTTGEGQEFAFAASPNSTSNIEQCRVSGSPTTHDGIDFYPAYTQELDPDGAGVGTMGFVDVTAIALVQYWNFALTTTGSGGCYTARRHARIEPFAVFGGATLAVYVTTEYPTLGEDCTLVN